jgi:hypothetical protein
MSKVAKPANEKRSIIIATPLAMVAIFAFGLFLFPPAHSATSVRRPSSATVRPGTKKQPSVTTSSTSLEPLPLAKTNLSTLPAAAPIKNQDSNSVGYSTASPQTTSNSGTTVSANKTDKNASSGSKGSRAQKSSLQSIISNLLH